ncbi:S8 family peptidase [Flavobacterium aquicola]|uniref:Subtilase family protein n=1 Tax=Flavobacterium aquicola TaxID=1682742 RepID=A0A3E0DYB6_9FLAO|nr:S8/S53 family peptidase [Flavobacterium aquicola]REG90453.1 subtilase family protein [Flavobacterium aquicola]
MTQLKVIVNKLNKRTSPVTDFANKSNIVGVVNEGFTFESVKQLKNNLGIWHQCKDGYWAWGKGFCDHKFLDSKNQIIDYNILSLLPQEFKKTNGQGITVGILDTGLFRHEAFANCKIIGKNFVDDNDDFVDRSLESHGTFVSGIIAAGMCDNNKMKGIASNVSLIIGKISADSTISDSDTILKGLVWLIKQQPDIINCSFDFSPLNKAVFDEILTSDNAKNIIWVAAGQDGTGTFNSTTYYPALNENFIAVGALKKEDLGLDEVNRINSHIKYIVPQLSFKSTDKFDFYSDAIGSSFASALVTGNLALIKSRLKQNGSNNVESSDCIKILDSNIEKLISADQLQNPFLIFKR